MSWVAHDGGRHGHERDPAQAGLNEAAGSGGAVYGERVAGSRFWCGFGIVGEGRQSCGDARIGTSDDRCRVPNDLAMALVAVTDTTTPVAARATEGSVSFE